MDIGSLHQFIYGKFEGGRGEYKVVAHTRHIQDQLLGLSEMESIVRSKRFWGTYPPRGKNIAVGVFPLEIKQQHYIVLGQVQPPVPSENLYRSYSQHRYIFIPEELLRPFGYRTFSLLEWLFSQIIPPVPVDNLSSSATYIECAEIKIPPLREAASEENDKFSQDAKLVLRCCKELDNEGNPFLPQVIRHILSEKKILINSVDGFPPPVKTYLPAISLLLPLDLRRSLAIVVGNVSIQECSWADLIINILNPEQIESTTLPKDFIWLNRKKSSFRTRDRIEIKNTLHKEEDHIRRIEESINADEAEDKITSLLYELENSNPARSSDGIYTFEEYRDASTKKRGNLFERVDKSSAHLMSELKKKCVIFGECYEALYAEIDSAVKEETIDIDNSSVELLETQLDNIIRISRRNSNNNLLLGKFLAGFFSPSSNLCVSIHQAMVKNRENADHDSEHKPKLSDVIQSLINYFENSNDLKSITENAFQGDIEKQIIALNQSFLILRERKIARALFLKWFSYYLEAPDLDLDVTTFFEWDWLRDLPLEDKYDFLTDFLWEVAKKIGDESNLDDLNYLIDKCSSYSKPVKVFLSYIDNSKSKELSSFELTPWLQQRLRSRNSQCRVSDICFLSLCRFVGLQEISIIYIIESIINFWVENAHDCSEKEHIFPSISDVLRVSRLSHSITDDRIIKNGATEENSEIYRRHLNIILKLRKHNLKADEYVRQSDQYLLCRFIDSTILANNEKMFLIYRQCVHEDEEYADIYDSDLRWIINRNTEVEDGFRRLLESSQKSLTLTDMEHEIVLHQSADRKVDSESDKKKEELHENHGGVNANMFGCTEMHEDEVNSTGEEEE